MTLRGSPFSIGADKWNGLSKLIEECGEVLQIAGKLIATSGEEEHWDGSNLRSRLEEELSDLQAAIDFFQKSNLLETSFAENRRVQKYELFSKWSKEQKSLDSQPSMKKTTVNIVEPLTGLLQHVKKLPHAEDYLVYELGRIITLAKEAKHESQTQAS